MSKTIRDKRRNDRERKRAERERKRAAGMPNAAQVQNAVTEAVAYALATLDRDACRGGWVPINAALVFAVAVDILSVRGPFDPKETRKAVRDLLAPPGCPPGQ